MLTLVRAIMGDSEAQLSLASEFWPGAPGRRNYRRAVYWARRAARSGNSRASDLLGQIVFDPEAPRADADREIFSELKSAAEAGDVAGQYSLGAAFEQGLGVARDLRQALHWYTMAAASGDSEAVAAVARLCASGEKTPDSIDVPPRFRVFETEPIAIADRDRPRPRSKD